jgi:hypothetical protein
MVDAVAVGTWCGAVRLLQRRKPTNPADARLARDAAATIRDGAEKKEPAVSERLKLVGRGLPQRPGSSAAPAAARRSAPARASRWPPAQ